VRVYIYYIIVGVGLQLSVFKMSHVAVKSLYLTQYLQ